jgi:hypothetical protein
MTCGWPLGCTVDSILANTSDLNFTPSIDLDIDSWYNWSIRVWDGENVSAYSETWNFSILSTSIIVLNGTVDFGSMGINMSDNTSDSTPEPFLIENDGNVKVNISLHAVNSLWLSQPLNTTYFQFMAGNSTETDAFDWSLSQTIYTPVDNLTKPVIAYLNYTQNDSARIEIAVKVPESEPQGTKSATIIFEAGYSG